MLKTWIPGTIDTRDQGLVATSWTNSGVTVVDSGKIGKCLSSTGSSQVIYTTNYTLSEKWSYSLWWKDNNTSAVWQYIVLLHNGTANDSNAQMAFLSYPADNRCEVCSNGKWHSTIRYTPGTWNHIAGTYDGTTCKCYLNGALYGSFTPGQTKTSTNMRIMHSCNCYVNDLRIWDGDVLSAKEVKEIAKGLVLHYPLNRDGFGGDNLFKVNCCSGGARATFLENGKRVKINWTSNIGDTYWYLGLASGVTLTQGETYTLSFQCSGLGSNAVSFRWCNLANYDVFLKNGLNTYTFQMPSTNITNPFFDDINRDANLSDLELWNFKLEKGSTATPWIPSPSDDLYSQMGLDNNIEYDCSGYKYNGAKGGTITYTPDTPRYSTATNFAENTSTVTITPCFSSGQQITEMSVSCWFKTNTLNSTAPNVFSLGENSFFRSRLGNATSIWYYIRVGSTQCSNTFAAGKTLTDNTWHLLVVTALNGVIKVYVDGALIGTGDHSATAKYLTCSNVGTTWHLAGYTANSENFIGSLSDFRIYATALSTDDILELYHTPETLSHNGTLLTQGEFVES